jgi:MFS family permease
MSQDTSGVAGSTAAVVIRGEMAARLDRLPLSRMQWELVFLMQMAYACIIATDGIARTLYPFVWEPTHLITSSQYSTIYALQVGIGILIGGFGMGWLSDKIGRRPTLILSALLAGIFIWPFGYVTGYPALIVLSIGLGLGSGGVLSINIVYSAEMISPLVRGRVIMGGQLLTIILLNIVLAGWVPHYLIPGHYRAYLFVLAGVNLLLAVLLAWRMSESPRWLEARERHDQARKVMERLEARVMKKHPVLPEPDLTPYQVVAEERTNIFAVFGKRYLVTTIFLLLIFVLGYGGIVYGNGAYGFVYLAITRGYSASFIFALNAWAGVVALFFYAINAFFGDRIERKYALLAGSIVFAGSWYGLYNTHGTTLLCTFWIGTWIGLILFLFNLYAFVPSNYPTRMRSLGTGWTDGVGHLGAWGGVLLSGVVFTAASPLGWILLITIPGALVPGLLVAIWGQRQRRRRLEEMAQ